MRILGVHDGHNASACLLVDGRIVHAVQEERLSRITNHNGFPVSAIEEILSQTGSDIGEIDYVSVSGHESPHSYTPDELPRQMRHDSPIRWLAKLGGADAIQRSRQKSRRIAQIKALGFPEEKIVFVEHHAAHAAAAYYGSPFGGEKVLLLTNDGGGDGLCATVSIGCNGRIRRLVGIPEANSLGLAYACATCLMGMRPNEDEHKIMELAAYASTQGTEKSYRILTDSFRFEKRDPMVFKARRNLRGKRLLSQLRDIRHSYRFDEVAGGLQRWAEEILQAWVRNCVQATGIRKLALSGGVFKNVRINKAISELAEVEGLFVFPSCGAETNAIGAAYRLYAQNCLQALSPIDTPPLGPIYWGREYSDYEVERSLLRRDRSGYVCVSCENIESEVAHLLARGEVVARVKGRMEFGTNSLGNRSILADASRPQTVQIIKGMVRNRDFWVPPGCSILKGREENYIVNPKEIPSPYMMISYGGAAKSDEIRAALHPYDLTVTPHVVEREWNPDYHHLIERFEDLTGRGGIVNVSFKFDSHPVVASPDDTLEVWEKSGLEYMALGNFLISKRPVELRRPAEAVVELPSRVRVPLGVS